MSAAPPTIITITRNLATGRYHPFAWLPAPLPSDDGAETVIRYRSRMHHTEGFEQLRDAQFSASEDLPGRAVLAYMRPVDVRIDPVGEDSWGPGEVPARTMFFSVRGKP